MSPVLSVIILTKNEENNIVDCLESVSFCDEIIVIDDNSSDRTEELVRSFTHQNTAFITHALKNNFAAQRNFGLEKSNGEWVLFVDADERVSEDLKKEILSVLYNRNETSVHGFLIQRLDSMWGRPLRHGETGNIALLRLAKKGDGTWKGAVHETWDVTKPISRLTHPLLHYPHPTIREFLSEIDYYTDLRARELYKQNISANWFSVLRFPIGKFIVNYIAKRGFLDGVEGFVFATLMSFHSFMVRGKLWLILQNKDIL